MTEQQSFDWESTTVVKIGLGCRSLVPKSSTDQGCQRVAMITNKGLLAVGVVHYTRPKAKPLGITHISLPITIEK